MRNARSVDHDVSSKARRAASMRTLHVGRRRVGDGADDLLGRRVDDVERSRLAVDQLAVDQQTGLVLRGGAVGHVSSSEVCAWCRHAGVRVGDGGPLDVWRGSGVAEAVDGVGVDAVGVELAGDEVARAHPPPVHVLPERDPGAGRARGRGEHLHPLERVPDPRG